MGDLPKKLDKAAILSAFKADMKAADTLRQEIETKVEAWKKEYDGEAYGNEEEGKSSLVSRDIKRQDEWQHASIKDSFVSDTDIIKCSPITAEDRPASEQNEILLNYQFTRKFNRYKFITDLIKVYYREGTVVAKTSWVYEDKKEKVMMPIHALDPMTQQPIIVDEVEVEQTIVVENRPHVELCRIQDIFIDPTCMGDLDNAQFVIHRYESDLSTLRKAGKYKNLKQVAKSMGSSNDPEFDDQDETEFKFQDVARKKVLVYEYWGNYDVNNDGIAEPVVCTWVDNTIIQLQDNPFPDKKIPFVLAANNSSPFVIHGEAAAELTGDNQKLATAIKRGIMDNMANSNNGQKGIPNGMLDSLNQKRFLNGDNFVFNGAQNNIFEGSYNAIPQSVFQVLDMIRSESESMLGVKDFGMNGGNLGSTARAAGGVLDAVAVRKLDIVRNIAENLIKPIMRKWMAYNSEFLEEEEVVAVTADQYVPIKREDLSGYVDVNIEVSTAEDNSAKAEKLSFLLQTLGQNLPAPMTMLLMAQIAKLNKMPDLAKQIEEYKPQPDPYAERMKELELEKLVSEIMERNSRTSENGVDVAAKQAKARLDNAKADEIGSSKDLKDLEFTRKAQGEDFAEKMAEKDHDRNTSLIQEQEKSKSATTK
ncbi:portal protein [Alteromonas phage vB_AmeP_PT11-V19]|nr:portal protein [Alteromonas phage vB_AmeP_PT11-V19]